MSRLRFYIGLFLWRLHIDAAGNPDTHPLSCRWYHLAFFAISMAMFGLTAGAVWVYLQGERFTEKTLSYEFVLLQYGFCRNNSLMSDDTNTLPLSVTCQWLQFDMGRTGSMYVNPVFFLWHRRKPCLTRSPFPIGVYMSGLIRGCGRLSWSVIILNNTDGLLRFSGSEATAAQGLCSLPALALVAHLI